ncbi:6-phosphogluconate dehydrogenase [Besnoitia besnoiti]|uniref:6-phosphogluconate dehydrogenase, decarboxylating n=1 Tax=Besnoitia besnoiti TaxID=94643 RepID=A0A2A9MI74_BESBE|nr:6-phosphogluconate dehydrogenase [Besnoitia besnoiti]PFH37599.1 6-phosphogluconate dehydrogenase [Besnoitia besnoiti]
MSCDVGLYGLAVMGLNLSLNMASRGFKVCVCNRTPSKIIVAVQKAEEQNVKNYIGIESITEFVAALKRPRRIVMMVQSGAPVDALIEQFLPLLEKGDCLVDGGNEFFENTERRERLCAAQGVLYMGLGVSGGEVGARHGPSLMPGGSPEAWELMKPILVQIAAKIDPSGATPSPGATTFTQAELENACVTHIGPGGAGNYVKMVHNGIEYGDMQLIAEAYYMLKYLCGQSNKQLQATFTEWNRGELNSYLVELTSKIFAKKDSLSDAYLVDQILDAAGSKGTGKWTVQQAADAGVAVPTIAAALDMRYISDDVALRKKMASVYAKSWPAPSQTASASADLARDAARALMCGKICCYAQGMQLLAVVSEKRGWQLNLAEISRIWKGGCIIRAAFLDTMRKAFSANPSLKNLLLDPQIAQTVVAGLPSLKRVVATSLCTSPPVRQEDFPIHLSVPCHSSSYFYLAANATAKLPLNLVQAQRDAFGAHTFKRIDREGVFHEENWATDV